jgi:hypothetical protein
MNIPAPNSDWGTIAQYALSFSGYTYVGGGPVELDLLWDKVCLDVENATVDELRACLFLIQRAARFCDVEGNDSDLEEARGLIELIRTKS